MVNELLMISSVTLIIPAEKLPDASRRTIVLAVLALVAALASTVAAATLLAVWLPTVLTTVAFCVPVTSPLRDPEKLVAVVAVVALPLKFAVIVLAEKLPEASRATIVLAVLRLVAVVAALATLPGVLIVASFESTIAAAESISALTINELDKLPEASLCTTPAVPNVLIDTVPPADIFIRSNPVVLNDKLPAFVDKPVVVLPVNANDGNAVVPAGNCNAPVIVSPDLRTFNEAAPVKLALIVPAEKLPEPSRATIALAVFALVAVVAELATLPAVLMVASLVSTIAADGSISAFTINELDNNPEESLCTIPALLNGVTVNELLTTSSVTLIAPAEKLPDASRLTIALAVLAAVAALASTVAAATLLAVCPPTVLTTVAPCVPVTSPLRDPEKLVAVVAVVALPLKFAVIVPAEKLPEPSRATIALAVFALVAVVAELATLPAVLMVASLVSTIAAAGSTSAFTINELDKSPEASL